MQSYLGHKQYEYSNHLGNVLSVISDKKIQVGDKINITETDYYVADLLSSMDYYPFGQTLPGRNFSLPPCEIQNVAINDTLHSETFDSGISPFSGGTKWFNVSNADGWLYVNSTVTGTDILTGEITYESGYGTSADFNISASTSYTLSLNVLLSLEDCPGDEIVCNVKDGSTIIASYTVSSSGVITIPFSSGTATTITVELIKLTATACGFRIDDLYLYSQHTDTITVCDGSVYGGKNNYRYGFNGQEKDNEVSGEGNSYTAEYWQYDPRLGRRWNIDPVVKPWESSYASFNNSPIFFADPSG